MVYCSTTQITDSPVNDVNYVDLLRIIEGSIEFRQSDHSYLSAEHHLKLKVNVFYLSFTVI